MAARDRLEPALQRVDLERGLVVDVAEQALTEVGDFCSGEASHETLDADDPDLDAADLEDDVLAVEHAHSRFLELLHDLVRAAGVVIVIAEDRDDGNGDRRARVCEHGRLLGEPVRRQVSCEEDEVGVAVDRRKALRDVLSERLGRMNVSGCGDADRRCHNGSDTRTRGRMNSGSPRLAAGIRPACRRRAHRPRSPSSWRR